MPHIEACLENSNLDYSDLFRILNLLLRISRRLVEECHEYAYNDGQMALRFDTLFGKVYDARGENGDEKVLHPRLTGAIQP